MRDAATQASGLAKDVGKEGPPSPAHPGAGRMPDNRRNDPQHPVKSAPNCIDVLNERRKLIPTIQCEPNHQPRVSDEARNVVNGSGLWDREDNGVQTPQAVQAHQPIHFHGAFRPCMPGRFLAGVLRGGGGGGDEEMMNR